jgi:putative hydrolase of the HAD superfamily
LEIGAKAIHIPFHTTWAHELIEKQENDHRYQTASKLTDILKVLKP